MSNIFFLTHRMSMGFGVSVVVNELCKYLTLAGHNILIGTMQFDYKISNVTIYQVEPNAEAIRNIAFENKVDLIIAHTSPYFEVLPDLTNQFVCLAWEHGDPSVEFFKEDAEERKNIILNKQLNVYPKIHGVIAISKFIRSDIKWPGADIVYNGSDHLPDFGKKTVIDISNSNNKSLRIGTLMRLGEGEALYKGNSLFLDICEKFKSENVNAEYFVMGRGSKDDAEIFKKKGFTVYRNSSDEERSTYLRSLDIFISPSQWEGFNLPIVEAMKSGTLSLLFDVGSHPEVCPFVYSNISEMTASVKAYSRNREMLLADSERCYNFVTSHFTWSKTIFSFLDIVSKRGYLTVTANLVNQNQNREIVISKSESNFKKGLKSLKKNGLKITLRKVKRAIRR